MFRFNFGKFLRSKYSYGLVFPVVITELLLLYKIFMARDQFVLEPPMSHFEKQVWVTYRAGFANYITDKRWGDWNESSRIELQNQKYPPFSTLNNLMPQLGLYSSHDKVVVKTHMRMIARHGIDGIIVPWVPRSVDGGFIDDSIQIILKQANKIGISVSIQILSYSNRNKQTLTNDIEYIKNKYAYHPIYLKFDGRPVIFFVDPNEIPDIQALLHDRNQEMFFVSSVTLHSTIGMLLENGFNGYTTANPNFQYYWSNTSVGWDKMHKDAVERGLLFIPTILPLYSNNYFDYMRDVNVNSRNNGEYYKNIFQTATDSNARIIIIESFNNWVDGTQIENAVDCDGHKLTFDNWGTEPDQYMKLTQKLIKDFKAKRNEVK